MPPSRSALFSSSARNTNPSRPNFFHCARRWSANMPRGEDVEIAEPENFLPFLVALFLVASLAPTFLLFFTRLPSSFENLAAANRQQNTSRRVVHEWRFRISKEPFFQPLCRPTDPAKRGVCTRHALRPVASRRAFTLFEARGINSKIMVYSECMHVDGRPALGQLLGRWRAT